MARHTEIKVLDDFDGAPDATTVEFGYGGGMFTIDLAGKNLQQFHEFMERHAAAGELVRRSANGQARVNGHRPRANGQTSASRAASREIRAWWKANEKDKRLKLPRWQAKGNIPEAVKDAFRDR